VLYVETGRWKSEGLEPRVEELGTIGVTPPPNLEWTLNTLSMSKGCGTLNLLDQVEARMSVCYFGNNVGLQWVISKLVLVSVFTVQNVC
jgi:hypothetical protein